MEFAPSQENVHPDHCSVWSPISQKKMLLQEQNQDMNVNYGFIDEFNSVSSLLDLLLCLTFQYGINHNAVCCNKRRNSSGNDKVV